MAVRLCVDGDHVASHLPEEQGRDRACGAASAVDDHANLRCAHVFQNRLHVSGNQVGVGRLRANPIPGRHWEARAVEGVLDLPLLVLVEGHPIRIPELDPVVRSRIMRGRDHDTARVISGSAGEGRCGDETRLDGVRAA